MTHLPDALRNIFRWKQKSESSVEEKILEIAAEHGISTEAVLAIASVAAEEYNEKIIQWRALTPREQEVAALICTRHTNGEIARRLGISIATVKTHIRNILRKFNLNSKDQLRQYFDGWDFGKIVVSSHFFGGKT